MSRVRASVRSWTCVGVVGVGVALILASCGTPAVAPNTLVSGVPSISISVPLTTVGCTATTCVAIGTSTSDVAPMSVGESRGAHGGWSAIAHTGDRQYGHHPRRVVLERRVPLRWSRCGGRRGVAVHDIDRRRDAGEHSRRRDRDAVGELLRATLVRGDRQRDGYGTSLRNHERRGRDLVYAGHHRATRRHGSLAGLRYATRLRRRDGVVERLQSTSTSPSMAVPPGHRG